MRDFAIGMSGFLVKPDGSKRTWLNLETSTSSGTPYCSAIEVRTPIVSIRPEIVLPSLAILMKISPGVPSSWKPPPDRLRLPLRPSRDPPGRLRCRRLHLAPVGVGALRAGLHGVERLRLLAAVAVDRDRLQAEAPGLDVRLLDVFHGRLLGDVDRLGDRPRDERLHG